MGLTVTCFTCDWGVAPNLKCWLFITEWSQPWDDACHCRQALITITHTRMAKHTTHTAAADRTCSSHFINMTLAAATFPTFNICYYFLNIVQSTNEQHKKYKRTRPLKNRRKYVQKSYTVEIFQCDNILTNIHIIILSSFRATQQVIWPVCLSRRKLHGHPCSLLTNIRKLVVHCGWLW